MTEAAIEPKRNPAPTAEQKEKADSSGAAQ